MMKKPAAADFSIWSAAAAWTALIYITVPFAGAFRKGLTERFGYGIYDHLFWIFGILGVFWLILVIRIFRKRRLAVRLVSLALLISVYAIYLRGMRYPVERIHFLEYGLLGILLFHGLVRHFPVMVSIVCAGCLSFWIGLGDEFIQHFLPDRVGTIQDSLLNLFSAVLGIGMALTYFKGYPSSRYSEGLQHIRTVLLFMGISVLFTDLFLVTVHSFGHRHEDREAGAIFSSLTSSELKSMDLQNTGKTKKESLYLDEADRHLLQREYYCTNDFLGADGSFYRQWDKCWSENRILEIWYRHFLEKYGDLDVWERLQSRDRELAEKVRGNKVKWTGEHRAALEGSTGGEGLYVSRVKSVILTGITLQTLLFLSFLVLGFLFWLDKTARRHGL